MIATTFPSRYKLMPTEFFIHFPPSLILIHIISHILSKRLPLGLPVMTVVPPLPAWDSGLQPSNPYIGIPHIRVCTDRCKRFHFFMKQQYGCNITML